MPQQKGQQKAARDSAGQFIKAMAPGTPPDMDISDLLPASESKISIEEDDMDYKETDLLSDSDKKWREIPPPKAWFLRKRERTEGQKKALAQASMRSMEDGPIDQRGGAKDKTG